MRRWICGRSMRSSRAHATWLARAKDKGGTFMRLSGVIARIVRDRGYGFLRAHNGHEYFYHRNNLVVGSVPFDDHRDGMPAEWDRQEAAKGPRAINVMVSPNLP